MQFVGFQYFTPSQYAILNTQYYLIAMEQKKRTLTTEQALQKLQALCAYQERCPQEVNQKLRDLGVFGEKAEKIIEKLEEDNFLSEKRFAIAYARGKFRIKGWGKIRIRQELKMRQISSEWIQQALAAVDTEGGYLEALEKILTQKISETNDPEKAAALALRRGYEPDLVWKMIKEMRVEIKEWRDDN
jgi:regulatory protein